MSFTKASDTAFFRHFFTNRILFLSFFLISISVTSQHRYQKALCEISIPTEIGLEGPTFVKFSFSYSGKDKILLSQVTPFVEMDVPKKWKKRHDFSLLNGFTFPYPIGSEEKKVISFNLHEYFSEMVPGNFKIPMQLNLTLLINDKKHNWNIQDTLNVNVSKTDPDRAEKYVRLILDSINIKNNWIRKTEFHQKLLSMHYDHPLIMNSCLKCVEDNDIPSIHPRCKERLSELAIIYNTLDTLYNYIMQNGSKEDNMIFIKINSAKSQFTSVQVQNLIKHGNPWIRLYTLQYCNVPYKETEINRLKEELNELLKSFDELEKKAKD